MKHAIPDVVTARRCVDALVEYLATKDDSPRAAADLRESVRLLSAQPRWQPIASVPDDGFFIVYEDGAMRMMFREGGAWKPTAVVVDQFGDAVEAWGHRQLKVRETGVYNPTHWMPLPPAPQETP